MIHNASTLTAITDARVVTPDGIRDDLAVMVRGGRIVDLVPATAVGDAKVIDLLGSYLLPGFVDTQVNGGGGVLFNDDPSPGTVRTIARAHARYGTTGLLATLVSDHLDVVERGRKAVDAVIRDGEQTVIGLHIEGPFINTERRGVHDAERIRPLTRATAERLAPLELGPTLITVAPEMAEPGAIRALVKRGFIVAAGHSAASHEQVAAAIDEGLTGFTHLYNAMSQLTVREPGVVGAALDSDNTYAGFIADGVHVAAACARIALRCKGPERLMLVTDAMPAVGTSQTTFELLGETITVEDGVYRDRHGALAGSSLDMATAVRGMMRLTGCDLVTAATMAATTPAHFLGLQRERGAIAPGLAADFAILDHELRPVATITGGLTAWSKNEEPLH
ncbi:N-acetylglucosamine-6-phosphate deacetylase [Marinihelvus fidelis]|uniref:N-acetylglucosamine-6-phosphate deacetylase n=1 Tax=Marinihelvus fidelis TaxID=2613842 RepID=A0A5N0TDL1_9GAMM|nr:N-acetylglucosamine-6-phosphate deacetylase [Marinihelvus fidelis]KAA9132781.1 N-acetylglucosamine-6-phosphate deacetylase [Marinihelvus fidelis]